MLRDRWRRCRRLLHQHETGPLQVAYQPDDGNSGHRIVSMVHTLSPFELQRKGEGRRDLVWGSRSEVGCVKHGRTLAGAIEHIKNNDAALRHDPPCLGRSMRRSRLSQATPSGHYPSLPLSGFSQRYRGRGHPPKPRPPRKRQSGARLCR